ncbi:aldehyde dehydrogenase family protein [Halioglobus maricola]|uniref:Aldehyde dehydrogenase family protein n=1 Tax=Halioglobus maricola TaxID=2601894 RepID=A0A5P9NJ16_9GAMM|nr:aldehyde dehydrogenase family protein [Halioglobus maricola]QFU75555.1 aldehyde dehydrogenase family protein [Halioglobus maricola]
MNKIDARNPRTGALDYQFTATSADEVSAIAARLALGQASWAADLDSRLAALEAWAVSMETHREELFAAVTADTGRRSVSALEVDGMVRRIRYWIEQAPALLAPPPEARSGNAANVGYLLQGVPVGLVGVISPWNFPLTLSLVDAIPALAAGCAVLLKPSEITSRFAPVLQKTIDAVPELAAVFHVVVGAGETGGAVVDNVDMLCFTGSVGTGRKVAVRCAENFIPTCLELGGKDPAIVLADADLDIAADAILRSAAGSNGQACMSLERVFVHASVCDSFVAKICERAQALQFNGPDIHSGQLPPYIFGLQADKVAAQLQDALDKGAVMHCGGMPEDVGGGAWQRPTVLTNISTDMLLMHEETFGPLIPILPFDSDEQAVAMANDSQFGLSGSVFGNEDHAITVASQLQVGAVGINDASMTALIHDVEKQSFKHSGMGPSRMGDQGLLRFLKTRAIMIQRDKPATMAVFDESLMP